MWKLFEFEEFCLKLIGYRFQYFDTKKHRLMKIWAAICVSSFLVIPILAIFEIYRNGTVLEAVVYCNQFIHPIGAALRLVVYYQQRNALWELLEKLRVLHEEAFSEAPRIVLISNKFIRKFRNYFFTGVLFVSVFGAIKKFLIVFENYEPEFSLDLKASPFVEIIVFYQFIFQLSNLFFQAFNILFIAIGKCLETQFKVLQQRIERLNFNDFKCRIKKKIDEINYRYHELVELTESFNNVYYFTTNTNFCLFVVVLGAYSFQFVMNPDISVKVNAGFFMVAIFILCHLLYSVGENISNESSKLAEVVYNLSWHDDQCRIRMKKNMLFMMMRFQKPVTVRTRYFKLNKENFANILQVLHSYMTLLKSLSSK